MKTFLAITVALTMLLAPASAQEAAPPTWSWILSIPVPGLGQIQMGQTGRGLAFLGGTVAPIVGGLLIKDQFNQPQLPLGTILGTSAIGLGLGVWGWSIVDAYLLQHMHQQEASDAEVDADTPALPENP